MAKPSHRTTANSQRLLEQYFYFFSSLLVAAVVVCGFHRTIEEKLVHAAPPRPFLLYVHGVVFFAWVLFFILQCGLVRIRRVEWHRRIGWFGAGLGVAMLVVGVSTVITMARFNRVQLHARHPEANLLISFLDITAFTVSFALAMYWRKQPEFHRRLQLLACFSLTAAAFGRFLPFFLSPATKHSSAAFVFAGWVTLYAGVDLLILVAMARDLVVARQIHPVYAYGLSIFVICQTFVMYTVFHHSAWWFETAQAIVG